MPETEPYFKAVSPEEESSSEDPTVKDQKAVEIEEAAKAPQAVEAGLEEKKAKARKELETMVEEKEDPYEKARGLWNELLSMQNQLEGTKTGWFSKLQFEGKLPDQFNNTEDGIAIKDFAKVLQYLEKTGDEEKAGLIRKYVETHKDYSKAIAKVSEDQVSRERQRAAKESH